MTPHENTNHFIFSSLKKNYDSIAYVYPFNIWCYHLIAFYFKNKFNSLNNTLTNYKTLVCQGCEEDFKIMVT